MLAEELVLLLLQQPQLVPPLLPQQLHLLPHLLVQQVLALFLQLPQQLPQQLLLLQLHMVLLPKLQRQLLATLRPQHQLLPPPSLQRRMVNLLMAWLLLQLQLQLLLTVFRQLEPLLQPLARLPQLRVWRLLVLLVQPLLVLEVLLQPPPPLQVHQLPLQQPQLEALQQLLRLQVVEKVWMPQQSRQQY